jgi:hypothetical protein
MLLAPVLSWLHHDELRSCRKYRIGNHRVIIRGRHTDCTYHWFYTKLHKKSEQDREEDVRFQARLLKALEMPHSRTIPTPAQLAELEE